MTWYYYSGPIITPIPVGGGEVKAIRPFSKFEVQANEVNGDKLQRLKARGHLRVCGMPAEARSKPPIRVVVEAVAPSPSEDSFSKSIVSEGAVSGAVSSVADPGIGADVDDDVKHKAARASRSRKRRVNTGKQEI